MTKHRKQTNNGIVAMQKHAMQTILEHAATAMQPEDGQARPPASVVYRGKLRAAQSKP